MFSISKIMTILLFNRIIQATNNTEYSLERIVPIILTGEAADGQISNSDNHSSLASQPDIQAHNVNCPSDKPSCEAKDCDGNETEFRCRATGPLQTCPCCPHSQLPSCPSITCMALPDVPLCTTALLQDCPCEELYFEPISPLLQYTDVPFSTDEELQQTQLEYTKFFEEHPEHRPGSEEWLERMQREGRLEEEGEMLSLSKPEEAPDLASWDLSSAWV